MAVSKFPARYSPFGANEHFYLPRYVGGNAVLGNTPATEFIGPIRFTTDSLGFRLTPYLKPRQRPEVLFFEGDSFTYGVGLSDEQTLPSVLTAQYGIPSYNGGRFHDDPEGLPELDWLLANLPGRPSTIVYTYLEHERPTSPDYIHGWKGALIRRAPALEGDLRYLKLLNTFFWEMAPSRVITTRLFKAFANDGVLPNSYRDQIRVMNMPDGKKLIFRDYEYEIPIQDRGHSVVLETARYFSWFKEQLAKRHLNLVVLLVPNRYTLYAPLLEGRGGSWIHYLDRLNVELNNRGVTTVNGLHAYHPVAELASGHLLFDREDTHWNPDGIKAIAAPLAGTLLKRCPKLASRTHN
ncbi:MAG TPA: hypothetical protein VK638_12545 [Edaphobacter sp.]|nr:hypothetical protein [Edaphobacter sp.]